MRVGKVVIALFASLGMACAQGTSAPSYETGLEDLAITSVRPGLVVPGSRLAVLGQGFVDEKLGASRLRVVGSLGATQVDLALPAKFQDGRSLVATWPSDRIPGVGGTLVGQAQVEVDSFVDGATHVSPPIGISIETRLALEPRLDSAREGVVHANDPIDLAGDGFLLGEGEGESVAIVSGCFRQDGSSPCVPIEPVELRLRPETAWDRTRAIVPLAPEIVGIKPGHFEGTVVVENRHLVSQAVFASAPLRVAYQLISSEIESISPDSVSLGQYVDVRGGGFVGDPSGQSGHVMFTLLELTGKFTPETGGTSAEVSVTLVPQFISGPLVRYVVNEEDELGQLVNLRAVAGAFEGSVRPIVRYGDDEIAGKEFPVRLGLAHVKQVIWVNFLPAYVDSLRHFGMRFADDGIRARVLEVAQRDYAGINVEFRVESPADFALFQSVDIGGTDPNGMGLLGYDNSPGKDVDNRRLYDKIGGVNAKTQEDGYPGYGGVFVDSFLAFSQHPGRFATSLNGGEQVFDEVFDLLRPERGGQPVGAAELVGLPRLTSGEGCPARSDDRPMHVACAVWVLGSMIGTTMTHEVGHSLGLANPHGSGFHNPGDLPNRLMDGGAARSFAERAELHGSGPARFCKDEFVYLRQILPKDEPEPAIERPACR